MATSKVAPPHISRLNRCGSAVRDEVGDRQHVVGAHARGQQRLVRVAEGGVGDQQPLLLPRPFGEFLGARVLAASWRVPSGGGAGFVPRNAAAVRVRAGRGLPATSGLPFTITSPR